MPSYDSPWKESLYQHLRPMLELLFPKLAARIDWREDHDPLEQELRKLAPEAETGNRLADALIRVRLLTGDDRILHAEAQAQPEDKAKFGERVYLYNYRARDKFRLPVESLVILGDDDPKWLPKKHVEQHDYSGLTFLFEPVKLLRWARRKKWLLGHANPMALFVLAHLESLRTRGNDEERATAKLALLLNLASRKLDGDDVRHWNRYLGWLLPLPPEIEDRMLADYEAQTKESKMAQTVDGMTWPEFISYPERRGIKKGEKQGEIKGRLEGLEISLKLKFQDAGLALMPELRKIEDPEHLAVILKAVGTADHLDEVRALLTPPTNAPDHEPDRGPFLSVRKAKSLDEFRAALAE